MLISLTGVSFSYQSLARPEAFCLRDINLEFPAGSYAAIIGASGSGKSTLISLLNAINLPTAGQVCLDGQDTKELKGKALRRLRQRVGVVWQFPEHQLFANTVEEDIAFGLSNLGLGPVDQNQLITQAMQQVGLDAALRKQSPFALSGGQQRRVAIAGILAMQPEVLVLDEPTAGLDPVGKRRLADLLVALQAQGITIVIVSHDLEMVAEYADNLCVLAEGRVWTQGSPRQVFARGDQLAQVGLAAPLITQVCSELAKYDARIPGDVVQLAAGARVIANLLRRQEDG